ncbi:MAG: lysylphosphatidylglycerol synthase transmembrane domain-containing protein [Chloroherpetonaceae bacterium]|nr:lysylphosphatidylglycerol synthase transmembrane domain-containing protein [Chloroherpetonaceae bacterium]
MKNALKIILSLGIAGFFFWLAFRDFTAKDFQDVMAAIADANFPLLVISFFILILSHIIRAWRWGLLLSTIKPKLSLINLFNSTMIGYAVNQALPRVGELTKSFNLSKAESLDPKKVLASVVVERIYDTLLYAVLLAGSVFLFRTPINAAFNKISLFGFQVTVEYATYLMLLAAIIIWLIATAISFYPEQISEKIASILKSNKISDHWSERIRRWISSFIEGSAALKDKTKYVEIIFSSLAIWSLYWMASLLPAFAVDFGKYGIGFWESLVVMCISALGQLITPGGAGTYQYACTVALETVFHVPKTDAAAYALITFFIQLFSSALVGVFCFFWQQIRFAEAAQDLTSVKAKG